MRAMRENEHTAEARTTPSGFYRRSLRWARNRVNRTSSRVIPGSHGCAAVFGDYEHFTRVKTNTPAVTNGP